MGSLDQQKCGGYNAQFLQELSDEHECPVCKMALREPVLTLCGHRLCFSCSEEMKRRNNGVLFCPLDKTILNSGEIFPDKFTERIILQLNIKCDNFLKSCQWTGELKAINNHLTSCEYQEVKCLNEQCSTALLRKELSDHMEKHCIYRLVTCQYCKLKINFCDNQGMRKEHATHANSSIQNHLSMAISKLDALENKMTLTVDTLENKIASKLNALETKITSNMESLEAKIASESIALENKVTSKVESFENKNASEAVALENKITSTVDALKNELI
ncbi:TNF receptor-associated factor 6-A isoform X2 [Hydra vulgaris]|uniref:TNF receptor-associated factor 6-A isoform X2 n=1 Tax=Hydra vulgaris TaxID=6087 RepID=UPI0032EA1C14